MKSTVLTLAVLASLVSSLSATVTLQFSLAGQARATGFSNQAGVAGIDGMRWGILVDTLGNGFEGTNTYDAANLNTSGFLTKLGGASTDDYYFAHPSSTLTSTSTATGGDPGGSGTITAIGPLTITGILNLNAGDDFGLFWFPTSPASGTAYGLLTNQGGTANFDIPADGSTQPYTAFFAGGVADPIKPANFQFFGVPEPSRLMLLGLGAVGLIFRRRRN